MRSKADIEKEIANIKADERHNYPPALVQINAPLALIQVALQSRIDALEWVLEGNYWDEPRCPKCFEIMYDDDGKYQCVTENCENCR